MVVIAPLGVSEVLIDESSGECESFKENALELCVCMMRDEVVLHLAELAAVVVCRIACIVAYSEIYVLADIAVESSI